MSAGMGSVYQRGKVWWIYYGFQGERHRESSGSTKKADANKLLKRRLAEMGRGQLIGPDQERLRYEDLEQIIEDEYRANERRSMRRLKTSLKHLRGFFGKMRALDITTDKIRRYIGTRQDEGAANASIQAELAALKRAFNLAAQAQQISNAPFIPSVKVSNTREGFFEAGELSALIKELPEPLKKVVRFAALTGWRKEEVLTLQWRQVDWDAGMVRLEPGTTKNSEGREFPFRSLPELEALIEEQRAHTDVVEHQVEQDRAVCLP